MDQQVRGIGSKLVLGLQLVCLVPAGAAGEDATNGKFYRVVDGKAVRTKIVVGQRRDSKVEILGGLTGSDTVVTAGQMKLREGVAVAIAGNGQSAIAGGQAKDTTTSNPGRAAPPATVPKS